MNYSELKQIFRQLKATSPRDNLTAHIIFTEDSFAKEYPLLSRAYRFDSDNKAFWPNMGGYSIFAYCLDMTSDQGVRLDWYMEEEGHLGGWKVEECYILEQMQDAAAIPHYYRTEQGDGTVCYFFGDTCIRVRESCENGKIHLEPVSGDQTACGEWVDLSIDRVYGYCTLLERHLNRKGIGMKIGDSVYTPRFCTVRIGAIFATEAEAHAAGFREPTYYEGDHIILGKSLDMYHMEFAAVPKGTSHA